MKGIIKRTISRIMNHPRAGEGATNVMIAIIIAVVAAGIIIGLLTSTFPELWNSLIARMQSLFS